MENAFNVAYALVAGAAGYALVVFATSVVGVPLLFAVVGVACLLAGAYLVDRTKTFVACTTLSVLMVLVMYIRT